MSCMARTGFLTLRDCGNPEARTCVNCARPMCEQHLSARSGFTQCLECAATAGAENLDPSDPEYAYGYRRGFYSQYGYAPFYFGDRQFDEYDVRSFHAGANRAGVVDDDAEKDAGFGDS